MYSLARVRSGSRASASSQSASADRSSPCSYCRRPWSRSGCPALGPAASSWPPSPPLRLSSGSINRLSRARLGHDALEHVQRPGQSFARLHQRAEFLRCDRLPRPLADGAGLRHRILYEIGAADDLRDAREQHVDLVEEALRLLLVLLELLRRAHLDHVVLVLVDHVTDLVLGEAARRRHRDRLLEAGLEVLRLHRHDAVGGDMEGDLDLDLAPRGAPETGQDELAEELVLLGAVVLALEDQDLHRRLVVLHRGEDVRLRRRDRGVLLDELVEVPADDHDAERVRRHVEEEDVVLLVEERRALDRGAERDDLVGVDALARILPEELSDELLHLRHTGHAADEDDVLDVGLADLRLLERLLADAD